MALSAADLRRMHADKPKPEEQPKPAFRRGGYSEGADNGGGKPRPASEALVKYLRDLVAERQPDADPAHVERVIAGGQARVSQAIAKLKAMPRVERPVEQAPVQQRLIHDEVWPGVYTVEEEGAPSGYYTFRVALQAEDAAFAPGATILSVLTGPDNNSDYTGIGFLRKGRLAPWKSRASQVTDPMRKAVARLLADPESVLRAKHCIQCGQTLTTPESIAAGIGPVCAGRM